MSRGLFHSRPDVAPDRSLSSSTEAGELSEEHIFAVMVIGDDHVECAIVHSDPGGLVYPIRASRAPIRAGERYTPSVCQLQTAAYEAWKGLDGPRLEYGRFFLCLPAWLCHSKEAHEKITLTDYDKRLSRFCTPTIGKHHVDILEERITRTMGPVHAVVDLWMHSFILDNDRVLADPSGATSISLRADAHVVLAELGPTREMLNFLKKMSIHVDVLTGPCSVAAGALSAAEIEEGTCVVDVGDRSTCISTYAGGSLRHSSVISTGGNDVVDAVAQKYSIARANVVACLNEWQDVLAGPTERRLSGLPLFLWAAKHPGLHQLDETAADTVSKICVSVQQHMNTVMNEMMIPVQRVIVIEQPDTALATRGLKQMLTDRLDMPCGAVAPAQRPPQVQNLDVTCGARVITLVKHVRRAKRRRQVYLSKYNETIADMATRQLCAGARETSWRVVHRALDMIAEYAARRAAQHKVSPVPPITVPKQPTPSITRRTILSRPHRKQFKYTLF